MRFIVLLLWLLLSYQLSAQNTSDTKQIYDKIDAQIVLNPSKARELSSFLQKIEQSENDSLESDVYLLRSYFYENNFGEAFQQIIKAEEQLSIEKVILNRNVLYAVGITEFDIDNENKNNPLFIINEEILLTVQFVKNGDINKISKQLNIISKKLTNGNKHFFRESISFLLTSLSERVRDPTLNEPILDLLNLYQNDLEFDILSKKIFPSKITDDWLSKTGTLIDGTTNVRLQMSYYNLLYDYYLSNNDVQNYTLISNKRDELLSRTSTDIIGGRSQWLYLKEKSFENIYINSKRDGIIICIIITFFGMVSIVVFVIRIHQEKLKSKRYQTLLSKIKTISSKKKESQTISENVKLSLLEKLEKLETTHFYLDPKISIQSLSKKLDSNSKYVSDTINTYKKKNFTSYINEMRIAYIKDRLNNDIVCRSYKIKILAEECGFSSHSVFSSVFKSIEGISPAQYIQLLK